MGSVRTTLWALSWVPVAVTATQVVGQPIRVQGRSMQPALNPDSSLGRSDLVFVQKYGLRAPDGLHRGDVILLRSPTEPSRVLVKRILGTPGDTVRPRPTSQYPKQKVKVPTNHLWVEGDYIHSLDSNDFGPISKGLVLGKVSWILWPFNRWGPVMARAPDGRVSEDH